MVKVWTPNGRKPIVYANGSKTWTNESGDLIIFSSDRNEPAIAVIAAGHWTRAERSDD